MRDGMQCFIRFSRTFAAVLLLFSLCAVQNARAQAGNPEALERLVKMAVETGIMPNEIPAINRPEFIRVVDAALNIEDDEPVFVTWLPDGPRIYPQYIMVWHEVVNERFGDDRYVLTYSPLTGTVAAYRGQAGQQAASFGVDGKLLFNNSLLFDRSTGGLWVQLTGLCIQGPEAGHTLQRLPAVWTRWGLARKALPDAQVLVKPGLYRKSYGQDPYGSYMKDDTYYQDDRMVHRFVFTDKRLHIKHRIVGLELGNRQAAFVIEEMAKQRVMNFKLGPYNLVALYDPALETVRVFDRLHNNRAINLEFREGLLTDLSNNSIWRSDGTFLAAGAAEYDQKMQSGGISIAPDQERLTEVPTVTSMWFAWLLFYPNTLLLPADIEWAAE